MLALLFCNRCLAEKECNVSYTLIHEGFQGSYTNEQFEDLIVRLHPDGYPETLDATEDETMPGKEFIIIFIYGSSASE
ncbi:MAG: hypothetical protein JXA20_14285 [Spirochaetes bacterium]|nr:hypothetical protein [Spirochaetota bacterium]